MSQPISASNPSSITPIALDQRRARQTPQEVSPFRVALQHGTRLLLSGAAAATKVVGMPALSAAISSSLPVASSSIDGGLGLDLGSDGALLPSGTTTAGTGVSNGMSEDLKLLALQSEIQRQSRQISLVSNLMKARHETSKAAIGNIRS